jgi:hypothetical protein
MGGSARPEARPSRRWQRWRVGALGLVVAVVGVLALVVLWQWLSGGSGDASAAPVGATESPSSATTIVITTWGNDVEVTATVGMGEGDSCQQSLSSERPGAYRCFVGNVVHDPCFASPQGIVCPEHPWARRAILLEGGADAAPIGEPLAQGLPWGIELADGQRCTFLGGATDLLDDLRANYGCDDGTVYGEPSGDLAWTVEYLPDGADRLTSVAVTTAWY